MQILHENSSYKVTVSLTKQVQNNAIKYIYQSKSKAELTKVNRKTLSHFVKLLG